MSYVDPGLRRRFQNASTALAIILMIFAVMILLGWATHLPFLTRLSEEYVSAKPNTAVGFLLAGLAAILYRFSNNRIPMLVVAGLMLALGIATLMQDVVSIDFGIDELLFSDTADAVDTGAAGRMSPLASTAFAILGASYLVMPHAAKLGQILSAISGFVGYFAFTGYLFGISRVFRIEAVTAMSAHAAVGLLLVAPAHWFARPEYGFARSFIQGVASGRIIRRLIPAAVCVPLLCGGLVQLGEQMEWFSSRFGETLVTLYTAVAFTGLGFWLVRVLERQQEERRGYERSLGRTGRALDRKKRELEQFAFTVSHDLKSPLVSVRGFIGLMVKDIKDGDFAAAEDSALEVSDAAAELNDIIDGILAYSRVGRVEEEVQEVDVVEVVESIVELHEQHRADGGIEVSIDRTMPRVQGFKTSLRRALENLYVNALRYAAKSDKPRIQIGGFSIDDKCQYYVKDNGPGIAPEYQEKVFELFQRLDVSEPGTGLGLASVAKIAELHHGRVFVESKPGEGATFFLEIPQNGVDLRE